MSSSMAPTALKISTEAAGTATNIQQQPNSPSKPKTSQFVDSLRENFRKVTNVTADFLRKDLRKEEQSAGTPTMLNSPSASLTSPRNLIEIKADVGKSENQMLDLSFLFADDEVMAGVDVKTEIMGDNLVDSELLDVDKLKEKLSELQEDEIICSIMQQGVDIREFSKMNEESLLKVEESYIHEFVKHSEGFRSLHGEIRKCDEILANIESFLYEFQKDLGSISSEIQSLQDKSSGLNVRIKNRTAVHDQLGQLLDGLVIQPDLIKKICDSEVNDIYQQYLTALNNKILFVNGHFGNNIKACQDILPELDKLKIKACEKIRDFFIDRISAIRKPSANIQMLQQSLFLKFKLFNRFLVEHHPEAAFEIRQVYSNTAAQFYYKQFSKYISSLSKLHMTIAEKTDLIGFDEVQKKSLFNVMTAPLSSLSTSSSSKAINKDKQNVFSLGDRKQTLVNLDAPVIICHVAEEKQQKYPFECLLKSLSQLLMDNCSSEAVFIKEFFYLQSDDLHGQVFEEIFDSTFKASIQFTKSLAEGSFDALGILIALRVSMQHHRIMENQRQMKLMNSLYNQINIVLWPRFQTLLDGHFQSVKKVDVKTMAKLDFHPHFIVRRFAEFGASILALNEGYEDTLLTTGFSRLKAEVEALMLRMASTFHDRRLQFVFLINNYDLIVTVFAESGREQEYFHKILNDHINDYLEEELLSYFGNLIVLIKDSEMLKDSSSISFDRFQKVAQEFNLNFKRALTNMNTFIMSSFPNFKNGTFILHSILKQLFVYYQKYWLLLEQMYGKQLQSKFGGKDEPMSIQTVVTELKKYKTNF